MPRSIWNGTITFGLIAVPVKVHSATEDRTVHFHQVHADDGDRIEQKRICSKEGTEIPYKQVVKGYEVRPGEYVVLSQDEIAAVAGEQAHVIELEEFVCAPEIEQFVDLEDVDPIYFDHPYFLLPGSDDDGATRAYRLLTEAMADTDRAALGRFAMRAKEDLAIVRVRDGVLTLTTMRFADEIRADDDVDAATHKRHKPPAKQLSAAVAVIEERSCPWEPDKYKDRYRARLKSVVDRKRKGKTIKPPDKDSAPPPPPDLMAALEQTLGELKESK
jgi:DNA end-binding protein Ku